MKHSMVTLCLIFFATITFSQEIKGKWNGKINKLNFVFTIKKVDNKYSTTIDIPTQRVFGIQSNKTIYKNDSLIVDASNIGLVFKGLIVKNGNQINGEMKENANSFPLILSKGDLTNQKRISRPQEPSLPYPYTEEDVLINNYKDKVVLSGTLTKPKGDDKFPVVVLISGSGPQDRDQTFAGHKTFLVLADHLTRNGIAVLRYDDRGFGKSTGVFTEATTLDFAIDALAAVNYLKTRKDIDTKNIGLIGHSEGGIIAPLAANKSKDISFIVSMAGTGIQGDELVLNQILQQRSFPVPDLNEYKKNIKVALKIAGRKGDISEIRRELKEHYYKTTVPIIKPLVGSDEKVDEIITNIVNTRTTNWNRFFYNYNPANEIEKLKVPALYIIGSKDTQVLPEMNTKGIRNAFEKNANPEHKIIQLEGLNHLFQESKTGEMSEYNTIEHTISPKALDAITLWISNRIN